MDARCRIELLGGLRVTQGERVVTRFRTQKAGSLLAYLAYYRAQSHPRERLIELLWPEVEPAAGRHRLNMTLSFLRRPLEPPGVPAGAILIADRTFVRLNPLGVTTDVAEFEAALAQAADSTSAAERCRFLKEAIALYRGELLPGCYDDWVQIEQQRLAEQFLQAIHQGSAYALETGDRDSALNYMLWAVSVDPLREELHLDIMRLYAAADRPADALRQYHDLERLLQTALGVEPTQEARALAEALARDAGPRVRAGKPRIQTPNASKTPPPIVPDEPRTPDAAPRLPLQFTRFFGREVEIAHLQALLGLDKSNLPVPPSPDDPPSRLITLSGPGGSGKTRLAIEVARRSADTFGGAVWFVPLADLSDPRLIPDAIVEALRLPRSPNLEPLEQVITFLNRVHDSGTEQARKPGPTLLLLDNFEHLLAQERRKSEDGAAVVRTLLDRIPTLILLVTSRQLLSLEGEREFMVAPFRTPHTEHYTPEQAVQYASVQLFTDRAQAIKPDFQVTRNNAAAIATLCTRLEGMPLALELAAARAQVLTPAQMLPQLERRFDFLVSRRRDAVERHRTLRAAIDWSYRLLSPPVQRFFCRLSVFRGGWTVEAAALVCGADKDVQDALDYLTQLRECTLVQTQARDSEIRFQMLETLREYAAEQLSTEELAAGEKRHAEYFLMLAERSDQQARRSWLMRVDADIQNLRAALQFWKADAEATGLGTLLGRQVAVLHEYWMKHGSLSEGRQWWDYLLSTHLREAGVERVTALVCAGLMARCAGDYTALEAMSNECLSISQGLGNRLGIATALIRRTDAAYWRQDYAGAVRLCEAAIDICHELGDGHRVAICYHALGNVAMKSGDLQAARSHLKRSLGMLNETDLPNVLDSLAYCEELDGEYEDACAIYRQVLRANVTQGDRLLSIVSIAGIATAALRRGEPDVAARLFAAVETLSVAVGYQEVYDWRGDIEASILGVRNALGEEAFAAAWAEGGAMTMEQAIAYALEEDTT